MKSYATLTVLAVLAAALLSSTAQAEGLSREQVVAELVRARAAGELDHAATEIDPGAVAIAYRAPAKLAAKKDGTDHSAKVGGEPAAH